MYMLKNVLRNLTAGPATRNYPLEKREPFKTYRGRLHNNVEKCIFCSTCARVCPTNAITINAKEAKWEYDPFVCVYCAACVEKCPAHCLAQDPEYRKPSVSQFHVLRVGTPRAKKKPAAAAPKPAPAAKQPEAPAAPSAETPAAKPAAPEQAAASGDQAKE